MIIHTKSYPRAALIGNPSDGFNGKTIAFLFSNFSVEVQLTPSSELILIPGSRDHTKYGSIHELCDDIRTYGYYAGIRLLKATIKKFVDYCKLSGINLPELNFTISYHSNIPKRLGLAGSSAIITAALKAIMKYYKIEIPPPIFANIVLSAETEELMISAGLQDRVAQAYETPVYMDFNKEIMDKQGYGLYETIPESLFPKIYIGYRSELSEGSEVVHNDLRERFDSGNMDVVNAMHKFAELTTQALFHLKNHEPVKLGPLMNENFDLRHSICNISYKNLEMIELARSLGASAKFTGSGGAIIGTYEDDSMYDELAKLFRSHKIDILKPEIIDQSES